MNLDSDDQERDSFIEEMNRRKKAGEKRMRIEEVRLKIEKIRCEKEGARQ